MAAMRAPVQLAEVRARKADRRTEAEELRMEVVAAGQEMRAMANRITNALIADDRMSALHFASRLAYLGGLYADPNHGGTAA